jgi:hypothetical protein
MNNYFIIESRCASKFTEVARHEDKAEATRLARIKCPDETLFWTHIVNGQEAGGGTVGKLPANFGM